MLSPLLHTPAGRAHTQALQVLRNISRHPTEAYWQRQLDDVRQLLLTHEEISRLFGPKTWALIQGTMATAGRVKTHDRSRLCEHLVALLWVPSTYKG